MDIQEERLRPVDTGLFLGLIPSVLPQSEGAEIVTHKRGWSGQPFLPRQRSTNVNPLPFSPLRRCQRRRLGQSFVILCRNRHVGKFLQPQNAP